MDDEETQEIIQAKNNGKKKDFRIQETDGMLMQESRMYVPNNMELKKAILDEAQISAYAMHLGDGQSERTIQMLEDMLRSSVLQFGDAWHKRLDLMKFAYNNSFHSSIGVAWFGKKGKQSPRYVGPYMITELVDLSHVIPPQPLEVNSNLTYDEEPVIILDWKDKEALKHLTKLREEKPSKLDDGNLRFANFKFGRIIRDFFRRVPGVLGSNSGETYLEDELHQSRLRGYDSSTYQ
ncbi:unnamed protein product [Malus baccata var. baccata]